MAPETMRARIARGCALAVLLTLAASPAGAFRIVDWNITNYPGNNPFFSQRQPHFRNVVGPLGADVFVVQEMQSQAGVDSFLTNVLNAVEPGQWAAAPFTNGNDTDNQLFYKPSRVELLGARWFYPNSGNLLRLVAEYRLRPVGYTGAAAEFRLLSQHLKASTGSSNVSQRTLEATGIRDTMNAYPPGTQAILAGDYNVYTTTEGAFIKLLESQANNIGRLYDPFNLSGTFNNGAFAPYHTQCPCLTCPAGSGFSGGGLDDRFDMFLPTLNMGDGQGLDLLPGTYRPVGNDGLHYNVNINDPPVIPEGQAYANSLWNASDHLPIRTNLMLPALSTVPASLAFGSVIVGAVAEQPLAITNASSALDSLDALDYTLSASVGFSASATPGTVPEGGLVEEPIAMDTSTPGIKAGSLTVTSDDGNEPSRAVTLDGTVLRHAAASLDSAASLLAATVDFGVHTAGNFTHQEIRVHNLGFDALQAQLALASAVISGGEGRFSVFNGFTPSLLGVLGQTLELAFDDASASTDSAYTAMLTLGSADEPLPGALAQPDLTVSLMAEVQSSGATGAGDEPLPTATVLFAPFPNPLRGSATVRFDVAAEGAVRVEAFDLSGRRVATMLDSRLTPGRYSVRWDGRKSDGTRLGAGLYFVRLSAPGIGAQTARLAIVR